MRMPDGRANPSHPHFSGLVSSCESPLRPFGSCWHSGGSLRRLQRREAGWWKQCPEVRLPVGRPGEGLGAGSRCRPWLNPSTLLLGQEHWRREAGQPRCQARKAIPPEQRPGGLPLPLPELGVSCLRAVGPEQGERCGGRRERRRASSSRGVGSLPYP